MNQSQFQLGSSESSSALTPILMGQAEAASNPNPADPAGPRPESYRRSKHQQQQRQLTEADSRRPDVGASYARFSSDLQRDESNEDQQRKCRELAEVNSHEIRPDLEFEDFATSGTKRERDGLNAMLKAGEAGEFNVLYVFSLSRLARESVITLPLLKDIVYVFRIRFISVTEGIDSDRDGWELIAAIYAIIHERYVKELSANVLRGQEGTVLGGYSVGDWCFGYGSQEVPGSEVSRRGKNVKPRKTYMILMEHAAWVVRIFHWYVEEGKSICWIVRELNRLKAPKDHRSTTPDWDHPLVVNVLSNAKYIGTWPWGEKYNSRDPKTGNLSQKFRSEEECRPWTRHFPDLRLIADEIFQHAQVKLEANAKKWDEHRKDKGRLSGSSESCNGRTVNKLLHKLMVCDACGHPFQYLGKRLRCSGYARGLCDVRTSLAAEPAEQRILEVILDRMEKDDEWFQLVHQHALASHREFLTHAPGELEAKVSELRELESRIARLVDSIELGNAAADVNARLSQRRQEQTALHRDVERLKAESRQQAPEPTEAWVREQLAHMRERLSDPSSGANEAIRNLLGRIRLIESQRPGRKSKILVGQLRLDIRCTVPDRGSVTAGHTLDHPGESILIEFDDRDPGDGPRNRAKELQDQGLLNVEIAKQLGVSRSRVTALIKEWYECHGQTVPDGRTRRSGLEVKHLEPPLYQSIADQVMLLYDQKQLLSEIAEQLNVDINTVTKSIKFWHKSRNLPVPDGRTRRKNLTRKSR